MKIVKINENILINIEQVYSLEKYNNKKEINEWKKLYDERLLEHMKYPPNIYITSINKDITLDFNKNIDFNDPINKEYIDGINDIIYSDIGPMPEFNETYKLIMATGLRININKDIYDKIYKYMEKYMDEETLCQ